MITRQKNSQTKPSQRLITTALSIFGTALLIVSVEAQEPLKSTLSGRPPLTVEWQNERVSLNADRIALSRILLEIARRTNLEVQGLDALTGEVSVSFSRLPLRDAIKRLLEGVNYVILEKNISREGARPVFVQVFIPGGDMLLTLASSETNLEPDDGRESLDRQEERLINLRLDDSMGRTDEIQKAISDRDPTVQEEAFELLARRDPHGAVNEALRATKSADLDTRLNALQVLQHRQQMDEWNTNSVLAEALSDQELVVREFAVQALAGREGPNVTLYLRNALRDPEPSVRRTVVESVAQKGNDFQLLYEALSDSDESVRSLAAAWIEQLREGR